MMSFGKWMQLREGPDTLGPGGMFTPQQGFEDTDGLAELKPVIDPIPKSRRAKKIEKLFGKKEEDCVAQNRQEG